MSFHPFTEEGYFAPSDLRAADDVMIARRNDREFLWLVGNREEAPARDEEQHTEIQKHRCDQDRTQQGYQAFSFEGVAVSRVQLHTASMGVSSVIMACIAMGGCQINDPCGFSTKGPLPMLHWLPDVSGQ